VSITLFTRSLVLKKKTNQAMSNAPAAASTWKSFFVSNTKCLLYNEAGDSLQQMTASGKSVDDCLSAIDSNPTVPLMVLPPLNKVHILFGLKTVGSDIFSPGKSYLFLSPHGALCTPVEIALVDMPSSSLSARDSQSHPE
jgi:hypothetical protein